MKKNKRKMFKTVFCSLALLIFFAIYFNSGNIQVYAKQSKVKQIHPVVFFKEGELDLDTLEFYKTNGVKLVFFSDEVTTLVDLAQNAKKLKSSGIGAVFSAKLLHQENDFIDFKEGKSETEGYNRIKELLESLVEAISNPDFTGISVDLSSDVLSKEDISALEEAFRVNQKIFKESQVYLILNEENHDLNIEKDIFKAVVAKIDQPVARITTEKDFTYYLDLWMEFSINNQIEIIPKISFSKKADEVIDGDDILAKGFYLKNKLVDENNIYGSSLVGINDTFLEKEKQDIFKDKFLVFLKEEISSLDEIDTTISSKLNIGRPENNISVYSATYNIMGTSSPDIELYCNSQLVETRGEQGSFGYLAKLVVGENRFTFSQLGEEKTVVITRYLPKEAQEKISIITESSMLPILDDYAYPKGKYELKCVAPSGSSVAASILGYTVSLKQQVATETTGIPAVFRGTLELWDDPPSDGFDNIGKVTYTLNFGGNVSSYSSKGSLIIAGSETKVGAISRRNMVNMYRDLEDVEDYKYSTTLDFGQWDYIVDATEMYFKLSMGDYVKKSDIELINVYKYNKGSLKNIEYTFGETSETITLLGIKDCIKEINQKENGQVDIIFYNIDAEAVSQGNSSKILELFLEKSALFSSGTIEIDKENHRLIFSLFKEDKDNLWGFGVEGGTGSDGEDAMIVYFKKNPYQTGMKPLDKKTFILDPGHGGHDPGALGTACSYGPVEKDLTLKTALQTKKYLEEQGATVLMIRDNDSFLTIYERAVLNEKIKPDIFVSIHLNSVAETTDSSSYGSEIYFYNENAKILAENILNNIETGLSRKNRGAKEGAYVVARPTSSPSILCEIGFMSNPQEYEEMASESVIDETGRAIAEGIKETIIQGGYH